MIRLACTNCKTVLLIDDAFAGGVCRCQHCGTIQTVPVAEKAGAGAGAGAGATVSGRAVGGGGTTRLSAGFEPRSSMPLSGTGLEELAGIVHSSGIAGSGLQSRRLTRPDAKPGGATATARRLPLWAVVGLIGAPVLGAALLVASFALRPHRPSASLNAPPSPNEIVSGSTSEAPTAAPSTGPNFCGVPVSGNAVVYLIDRGSGSKEIFPALEDATLRSIQSLGAGKRFQVLFWDNGSETAGYPLGSMTYATAENLEAARRAIESVAVFGASQVNGVFPAALASQPDRIVVVTPKGWSLDAGWADSLLKLRGQAGPVIDTFSLGNGSAGAGLKRLAEQTGGKFTPLSDAQLRAAGGS